MINYYNELLSKYGKQGWWPVTPKNAFIPEYGINIENNKQRLEVCLGAVLTQNTSWKNVEKAIIELNKNNLINIGKILSIKKEQLAKVIRSSGYYNQKTITLKNLCMFLQSYSFEDLMKKDTFVLREMLLNIKGIGKETADSIILYALEKAIFVVDVYTKKFLRRIGISLYDKDYDNIQKWFMKQLPNDVDLFKEFHALIVEDGKKNKRLKKN